MGKSIPEKGASWETVRHELESLGKGDADWRSARTAVYVFNAGEDVLRVAKDAYALYQSENALGPLAFPSLKRMEDDVVAMGLSLLHGPEGACGNMTSGGTESILMAVKTCRDQARAQGRDTTDGEILAPLSAHPAFDKAAHYLGLRVVRVPVARDMRADVPAMADAIGPRTLMLVGSAPCFPYGVIDPIEALGDVARQRDVWLHVDACVGGYFAPFARMNGVDVPPFDFEVPAVRSMSADLHKYGYAAKGASTVLHRSEEQREHQIFEFGDWPGGHMTTPTLAGTRPGGAIAGAWAVMHYLGVEGYCEKARQVTDAREKLSEGFAELGLHALGDPQLGLIAYRSDDLDMRAVYGQLFRKGWFTGFTTDPASIHLMLSPAHLQVVDSYLEDLRAAITHVRETGATGDGVVTRYA
ncbi:MAG: aspartate aminotransferase family protein [Deltaproteobacteria bacterium]|nr:aspartate aminotransferase family protein [Deltaproteobacteria bacterium]MBW2412982.1 aspartate aminotransferase family protein [Deltaproteobacteria bacterium]